MSYLLNRIYNELNIPCYYLNDILHCYGIPVDKLDELYNLILDCRYTYIVDKLICIDSLINVQLRVNELYVQ